MLDQEIDRRNLDSPLVCSNGRTIIADVFYGSPRNFLGGNGPTLNFDTGSSCEHR